MRERLSASKQVGAYGDRRANVEGAFQCDRRLSGEHVVLVDDIITSGSTAAECAATMSGAGARFVTVLFVARNQRIIRCGSSNGLKCEEPGCEGQLVMKFNRAKGTAFWGCTQFRGSGCRGTLEWNEGIRRLNALNTRDQIEDLPDIQF